MADQEVQFQLQLQLQLYSYTATTTVVLFTTVQWGEFWVNNQGGLIITGHWSATPIYYKWPFLDILYVAF